LFRLKGRILKKTRIPRVILGGKERNQSKTISHNQVNKEFLKKF